MAGQEKRGRRLVLGQVPDPLRAHGAWVYLVVSVLAGTALTSNRGWVGALLAGTGFVGVLVLSSALTVARRPAAVMRGGVGLTLSVGAPVLALCMGADRSFLVVGLGAVPLAVTAAFFASSRGFQSRAALSFGVSALVVAAPVAATAGGASPATALVLFALLAPVFFWRTWRLARALGAGWTLERIRRRGLLESAVALSWAGVAVALTWLVC